MTAQRIYFDYNASTPIDPAVAAAMKPFLDDHYGNPSSGHWAATTAKVALETARGQVAALLGCHNDEVVFTSGGSEANNLALKGGFYALRSKGDHIVTTRIEHPAIIEPCRFLERLGARVTFLPVDGAGRVDPEGLRKAITPVADCTAGEQLLEQMPQAAFCLRQSLPAIFDTREFAADGGLMSYGASQTSAYRQAGQYVGRIIEGAKPSELPVVQSTRFELVINRATANALKLQIPDKLTALADEIID